MILLNYHLQAAAAGNDSPDFKISIEHGEYRKVLLAPSQAALERNRDDLQQSGINLPESKVIQRDIDLLDRVLRSEGFYEHTITYETSDAGVEYRIIPGKAFHIAGRSIQSPQENILVPDPDVIGLKHGMRLRAADILAAQAALDRLLLERNCLWQGGSSYEVRLHRETATADVLFRINPAEQVKFGNISYTGLDTVSESYVRGESRLKPGQCYQSISIEKARLRYLQSGLFSMVDSRITPPHDGVVDLEFDFKERSHKTIKLGGAYSFDESISLTAGWQHRNYFGRAEKLEIEGKVSSLYRTINSTLTLPAFRTPGQLLILKAELGTENLEAFDATGFTFTATLRRRIREHLNASGGIQYQFRSIQEINHEDTHSLISIPLALEYDSRDNLLDPGRGRVTTLKIQPFVDMLDTEVIYMKSTLAASIYHTYPDMLLQPTLAARAVLGSISGVASATVPADSRFYSGGGGSVRGYPFQLLGPVENRNPTGGRSLVEVTLETRLRFTRSWGGAVFIDGGNVYSGPMPRFSKGLRWAAGFGARYVTALAPVRLDIAFPLNRRRGIDDAFQLYISLAQAF